jgi:hypothetical protein
VSKAPAVYTWLAEQPGDFIVTEIPTSRFTNYDRFFQRIDHKRVLSNDRLDQIADLQNLAELRQTRRMFGGGDETALFWRFASRLAGYGVKYVIVWLHDPFPRNPVLHSFVEKGTDVTMMWTPEEIARWSQETGAFREVKRFDDAVVYEVAAKPMKILIAAPDGRTLIIGGDEATIILGPFTFDILVQPGASDTITATIVFESNYPVQEMPGLTGDEKRYVLSAPIHDIETIIQLSRPGHRVSPTSELWKIRIISFTIEAAK